MKSVRSQLPGSGGVHTVDAKPIAWEGRREAPRRGSVVLDTRELRPFGASGCSGNATPIARERYANHHASRTDARASVARDRSGLGASHDLFPRSAAICHVAGLAPDPVAESTVRGRLHADARRLHAIEHRFRLPPPHRAAPGDGPQAPGLLPFGYERGQFGWFLPRLTDLRPLRDPDLLPERGRRRGRSRHVGYRARFQRTTVLRVADADLDAAGNATPLPP